MMTQLKDFATSVVAVVEPETPALLVAQLMRTHRLRRLVIADGEGRLAGIVSLEDVLEPMARELADLAASLAGARDREISERV